MWAVPGENTPKIRWHKRRKKFTVDTFWFVLEPLASRTRARTSVSRRYSNQLPAVESGVRADARTPSSSSSRICAFSSWVSLTGEVLPVPDCRVCADTPGRQGNQGKILDYRSHIVSTSIHLRSRSRRQLPSSPIFVSLARISFIRQIDRRVENNLSVFRERLLMFHRNCPRLNIWHATTLESINRSKISVDCRSLLLANTR